MTHQLINSDTILDIPPTVALCPYCGAKLYAVCEGWTEAEDGSGWEADEVHLDCVSEPSIRSRKHKAWLDQHTYMPYVYWLPVAKKVKKWINEHYRFDLFSAGDLEAWNEGVKDWSNRKEKINER